MVTDRVVFDHTAATTKGPRWLLALTNVKPQTLLPEDRGIASQRRPAVQIGCRKTQKRGYT
jgi:hypothetical protein